MIINYLKKLFQIKKKSTNRFSPRELFYYNFTNSKYHQWILKDKYILRSFNYFFSTLDENTIKRYASNRKLLFVQASGSLSCAFSSMSNTDLIIIFPDLYKMLKFASPEQALAILAHELGHLVYKHSQKNISPINAQFEADSFAVGLGYEDELKEILLNYKNNSDCQMRLKHLDSWIPGN